MFTYEWLGLPSESGIQPVLHRSVTSSRNLQAVIAHAKTELQKKEIFETGQTYGVRILDSDSVLVWTGNLTIPDTSKGNPGRNRASWRGFSFDVG